MAGKELFGTDGIRGVAGEYPLDLRTVYLAGRALGQSLRKVTPSGESVRVLLGEDTRESSRWIAETFAGGLADEGVDAHSAGVITTPGVAYLARTDRCNAGVMISASHNSYQDNGIKVFAHSGYKLPDDLEHEVEQTLFALAEKLPPGTEGRIPLQGEDTLRQRYLDFLAGLLPKGDSFAKLKVVMDCANGAASAMAPELFRRLGAEVVALSAAPDGRNINLRCGSLHMENLQAAVLKEKAHLGVAFDGDADRALFVTADGALVNGDGVMLMAARHLKAQDRLGGSLVIGTIMSNLGLEIALGQEGMKLARTPVGDKYVLEEMLRSGAKLGGEQSGHIIFLADHTTGDGLLTALRVTQIVAESGRSLSDLVAGMTACPQVIKNLKVSSKPPIDTLPLVTAAIQKSQQELGSRGRVIVRYSGTENLVRIMVEAETAADVDRHVAAIASAFQKDIGLAKTAG